MNRHIQALVFAIVAIIAGYNADALHMEGVKYIAFTCAGVLLILEAINWYIDIK